MGAKVEACLRAMELLAQKPWNDPATTAQTRALYVEVAGLENTEYEDRQPYVPKRYQSASSWRSELAKALEAEGVDPDAWWPFILRVPDSIDRTFLTIDVITRLARTGRVERSRAYLEHLHPAEVDGTPTRHWGHRALLAHFAATADIAAFDAELPAAEPRRSPRNEIDRTRGALVEAVLIQKGWAAARPLVARPELATWGWVALMHVANVVPYATIRECVDDYPHPVNAQGRVGLLTFALGHGPSGFDRGAFEELLPLAAALDPKIRAGDCSLRDDCLVNLGLASATVADATRCRKLARGKLAKTLLTEHIEALAARTAGG